MGIDMTATSLLRKHYMTMHNVMVLHNVKLYSTCSVYTCTKVLLLSAVSITKVSKPQHIVHRIKQYTLHAPIHAGTCMQCLLIDKTKVIAVSCTFT